MRLPRPVLAAAAMWVICGCSDVTTPEVPPPVTTTFLKDIVVPNLPSPYYHFEYDARGVMTHASFAAGFLSYEFTYAGGRIASQQSVGPGNTDRLVYHHDAAGRAALVEYRDADGLVYAQVSLAYDGDRLAGLERRRRTPGGDLVLNKEMTFSYDADGNVREITTHTPAIEGLQSDQTFTDLYEDYDDAVNVDGFSLLHAEFFDHLVLLPGVVLQKQNARRVTRTGDAENYRVDYTYTYDGAGRPLVQNGTLLFTSGTNAGKQFQTQSSYSYY